MTGSGAAYARRFFCLLMGRREAFCDLLEQPQGPYDVPRRQQPAARIIAAPCKALRNSV
jgi:hypothetical protein